MHRLADRTDFGRLNRSERKAPLKANIQTPVLMMGWWLYEVT